MKRNLSQNRPPRRKASQQQPLPRVLIVTEGSKTEPRYFQEQAIALELSDAQVVVDGKSGSTPMSVFRHSRERYGQAKGTGNDFARVYCVFDQNAHPDYRAALDAIRKALPRNTFFAVNSVPCFEYWLLLHHKFTTSPFTRSGARSPADMVVAQLREFMPDYRKSAPGIYAALADKLATAKRNAARALRQAEQTGTDNPTTRVHELVEYLESIKKSEPS